MRAATVNGIYRAGLRTERALAVLVFASLCGIPLAETFSREVLGHSLSGATAAVQYLTLVVTFVDAAAAARSSQLLALATARWITGSWQRPLRLATSLLTVAITSWLIVASVAHGVWNGLAYVLFGFGTKVGALGVEATFQDESMDVGMKSLGILPRIGTPGLTHR